MINTMDMIDMANLMEVQLESHIGVEYKAVQLKTTFIVISSLV